jgi:hypothetical protein
MSSYATTLIKHKELPWLKLSILFAFISVLGTHYVRSGLEPGEIILPWNYPVALIITTILSSLALGLYVLRNPNSFHLNIFSYMLFASSVSCLGWTVLDELAIIFVAFALLFAMTRGVQALNNDNKDSIYLFSYLVTILIFFFTAISGLIFWGEIKAVRFILLFFALLILSWNLIFYEWKIPSKKELFSHLIKLGLIYYVLILSLGFLKIIIDPTFIFAKFRGLGGTSAMGALFPGIVLIPICFYVINSREFHEIKISTYFTLFLFFLCSLLMDARAGYLVIFLSLFMLPFSEGFRRTLYVFTISIGVVVLTSTIVLQQPLWIMDAIESSLGAFTIEAGTRDNAYYNQSYLDSKGDIGRFMFSYCAYKTAFSSPFSYLIGVGSYGFFENLSPCIEAFKTEYSLPDYTRNTALGGGMPRPPALGAWVIENGWIATALLLLTIICAILTNFLSRQKSRLIITDRKNLHFLPCLLIIPVWAYFAEYQDYVFLYFLIMPFGFLHMITKAKS